jgi:hypothetical protein
MPSTPHCSTGSAGVALMFRNCKVGIGIGRLKTSSRQQRPGTQPRPHPRTATAGRAPCTDPDWRWFGNPAGGVAPAGAGLEQRQRSLPNSLRRRRHRCPPKSLRPNRFRRVRNRSDVDVIPCLVTFHQQVRLDTQRFLRRWRNDCPTAGHLDDLSLERPSANELPNPNLDLAKVPEKDLARHRTVENPLGVGLQSFDSVEPLREVTQNVVMVVGHAVPGPSDEHGIGNESLQARR